MEGEEKCNDIIRYYLLVKSRLNLLYFVFLIHNKKRYCHLSSSFSRLPAMLPDFLDQFLSFHIYFFQVFWSLNLNNIIE